VPEHVLCRTGELAPGDRRGFKIGPHRIVLCRTHRGFYALRDICPHHGARLSEGVLTGTNLPSDFGQYHYGRSEEILRCPHHGWEVDILTGRTLHDPEHKRVRTYPVHVEDDRVMVKLDG
jgi:nitrite reductase/ring-hydroxylating ferredoxin subunit